MGLEKKEMTNIEEWGLIISFLDGDDPRPAKEQFDAHYVSGWHNFDGFTLNHESLELSYPGDPPMNPVSIMLFRKEIIILYPFAWVLILQKDNSWEVCRMD
jgi:hypothetical protein